MTQISQWKQYADLALKQLGRKSSFYRETKLVGRKLSTEATAVNKGAETGIASE